MKPANAAGPAAPTLRHWRRVLRTPSPPRPGPNPLGPRRRARCAWLRGPQTGLARMPQKVHVDRPGLLCRPGHAPIGVGRPGRRPGALGKDDNDRRPNFKWGLQLQNIGLNKSLNIDLNAFVEDATNPQSPLSAKQASRGAADFSSFPQENYDIALSIDRALINRVLQLSYERRNFEEIRQSDGSSFKLMATPLIDYVKTPVGVAIKPTETFVKLRVSIENKPDSVFLKSTIVVDFDIIAKIRQLSDKTGMQLVLHSIDTDSMYLDDKYISFAGSLFKGKVREGVKDELRKKSAGWKNKDEVIPGSLPLPPEILGIKLDINRVLMDPNGHLVMLLDYAKTGAKK